MNKEFLEKMDSLGLSLEESTYSIVSSLSDYVNNVQNLDLCLDLSAEELEESFSQVLTDANELAVLVSGMTFHLGELHANHKKMIEDLKSKSEKKTPESKTKSKNQVHKLGCPAGKSKSYCRDSKGRFA